MHRIRLMEKLGTWLFILMWIPFVCVFVSTAVQEGDFARFTDNFFPNLFSARPDGLSIFASVSIALTIGMSVVAMLLTFGAPFLASQHNKRIIRTGKPAQAEIVSAENTGTYINRQPVVRFQLEVRPAGETPFTSETQRLIAYADIGRLQPGAIVAVRYDPQSLDVALED